MLAIGPYLKPHMYHVGNNRSVCKIVIISAYILFILNSMSRDYTELFVIVIVVVVFAYNL